MAPTCMSGYPAVPLLLLPRSTQLMLIIFLTVPREVLMCTMRSTDVLVVLA